MKTAKDVLKSIKDNDVKYVDLRFTDPRGKWQHVTFDIGMIDEEICAEGTMFDGSSIAGWKAINESDMVLMPELKTAVMDPFTAQPTMVIVCDVYESGTGPATLCPTPARGAPPEGSKPGTTTRDARHAALLDAEPVALAAGRDELRRLVAVATVLAEFGGSQFSSFKKRLAEAAVTKLAPIPAETVRMMQDPAEIDPILADGAARARAIAQPIMAEVKDVVGLVRAPIA